MGPEETRLVLQIEANIKSLERAMKQTGVLVDKTVKGVNDNMRSSGVVTEKTARQIEGSMRNATRNLGFQFQDVATQLLSGQSPFTIAAQQSSQAAEAMRELGRNGGVLRGTFAALGSVISPQAIGISAAILGFGYLLQATQEYFAEAQKGGKVTAEEAAKQTAEIRQIAEAWANEATPALQEYLNRLLKISEETEKAARRNELVDKVFEPAKAEVEKLGGEIENIIAIMQSAGPELAQPAIEMGRAWDEVRRKTEANERALQEVKHLQDLVAQAQQSQIPAVQQLADKIRQSLFPVLQEAARLAGEVKISTDFSNPITGPSRGPGGPIDMRGANASIRAQSEVYRREQMIKQGEEDAKAYRTGLLNYLAKDKPLSHIADLDPEFQNRLAQFLAAAGEQAGRITITSGARSIERQAQLWQQALEKYGSPEAARKWVAPPGRSQHNVGRAADLAFESEAVKKWAHANAEAFGLVFRLDNEAWHIELQREEGRKQKKRSLDDLLLTEKQQVALQEQINAINADATLTDEQRQFAIDKLMASTKLLNQAQAEGIPITAAVKASIEQQATAFALAEQQQRTLSQAHREAARSMAEQTRANEQLAQQYSQIAQGALRGFVSDLRSGVSAGEAFRNSLNRIIDGLIDLTIQAMFAQQGFKNFFSSLAGFGGFGGLLGGGGQFGIAAGGGIGLYHQGGIVGPGHGPRRNVSPLMFANAPRLHNGLLPGEFPAILQRGEMVIPRSTTIRGSGSRIDNSVHQQNHIAIDMGREYVAANNADAKAVGERINKAVEAILVRESRPGGLLRRVPT